MGAHRCGSTAMQSFLSQERSTLKKLGIDVHLRSDLSSGAIDLRRLHRHHRFDPRRYFKLRRAFRQIQELDDDKIIISDENLMGTMPGVRGHGFYPHVGALVQALVDLKGLAQDNLEVAPRLIVRRQDHFLESVYAFRVSRGLAMSFDAFITAVARTRLSWLRIAQMLEDQSSVLTSQIAVVEAWPRMSGASQALAFLTGTPEAEATVTGLAGNRRQTKNALAVMLALNQAKINWRKIPMLSNALNQLAKETTSAEGEQLDRITEHLSIWQAQRLTTCFNPVIKLQFTNAERQALLAEYEDENRAFFKLPLVVSNHETWR
jgi:hypothetical protein